MASVVVSTCAPKDGWLVAGSMAAAGVVVSTCASNHGWLAAGSMAAVFVDEYRKETRVSDWSIQMIGHIASTTIFPNIQHPSHGVLNFIG